MHPPPPPHPLLQRCHCQSLIFSAVWLAAGADQWLAESHRDGQHCGHSGHLRVWGWYSAWCINRTEHSLVVLDVTLELLHVPLQDLGVNSFEQLCINFANEQLQHFVNKAVIAQEQVSGLYAGSMKINWHRVPLSDKSPFIKWCKGFDQWHLQMSFRSDIIH